MAKLQINVRLSEEQHDAIHAAVYVRELRSPQALIDPLLEELTTQLLADEDVAAAVGLRTKNRRPHGTVSEIAKQRRSPRAS